MENEKTVALSYGENWASGYEEVEADFSIRETLLSAQRCAQAVLEKAGFASIEKIEMKYLPPGAHGCGDPLRQRAEIHVKVWF